MERYGAKYALSQSREFPKSHLRVMDALVTIRETDKVLEIGSGNGSLLSLLRSRSDQVIGLDIHSISPKAPFVRGDGRCLPFRPRAFDIVISSHTLEHIDNLHAVFEEIDLVTKPGGKGLHFFPAHLLTKAEGAIFDVFRMGERNPLRAWREAHALHIHDLNPRKIQEFIAKTKLRVVGSKKFFVPETFGTNWAVVLEKATDD